MKAILIESFRGIMSMLRRNANRVNGHAFYCRSCFLYADAAVLCFALAFALWIPSRSGAPLCNPESMFQGHGFWRILSAWALGFIFLYALSCDGGEEEYNAQHDTGKFPDEEEAEGAETSDESSDTSIICELEAPDQETDGEMI